MPKANNLSINVASSNTATHPGGFTSPHTPLSPRSPPPPTPNSAGANARGAHAYGDGYDNHMNSPINALPPPLSSPRSPGFGAKIFGNRLASKSATKLSSSSLSASASKNASPSRSPKHNYKNENSGNSGYLNSQGGGGGGSGGGNSGIGIGVGSAVNKSSPDVSVSHLLSSHTGHDESPAGDFSPDQLRSAATLPAHPNSTDKEKASSRKTQHKFGNFLNRKSSLRGDEPTPSSHSTTISPADPAPPSSSYSSNSTKRGEKPKPGPIKAITQPIDVPVRTAPVEKERGFRSAMNSALRNRSLDRADATSPSNSHDGVERLSSSHHSHSTHSHKPSSLGPNGASGSNHGSVMSNIRSGGTRAAEGISKARRGIFGGLSKLNRSGSSSNEREPMRAEPYELKVLILPLEEQARITRIAKRLHYCKDKTEFWLPAFPYRCIDYLSDRGTYSEGLYRVPGSELEIKHYMARFDREHDIDLFECEDLHDVNVVATMLKRWLSNLPPVLPPSTQSAIISKCSESNPAVPGGTTPPFMKEQLSNLPPWNYYLLFAITGHISFLHNHREQNKMTYENLFRCFATRALQVEPYIFWWLVWDWRGCWAGCAREDEFKVKEYAILDSMQDSEEVEEARGREHKKTTEVKKKDSKEDKDLRQAEKEKEKDRARRAREKQSVSALSKQSVSKSSRPSTAHAHSHSSVSVSSTGTGKTQHPPLPTRTKTSPPPPPVEKVTVKPVPQDREYEKESASRALSSSDSSKPSITGQSSAGMSDPSREEEVETTSRATNGGMQRREAPEKVDDGRLKTTDVDMGLPMLSPLKPLSPFGLH